MEKFIQSYLRRVGGFRDSALARVESRLRAFLHEHEFSDFADGEAFADILLDELETAWGKGWASKPVRGAISSTTRSIYEYYRLRDVTVFGDSDPIALRLGGPDRASISFIGRLDHFYFSKFADNTQQPMRKFFVEQYFENGAALFGRESSEEMAAFREASGERFANLTHRQTVTIVQTAVARTRNWAHIGTMAQAEIEWAQLIATLDSRTTPLCEFLDQKLLRVGVAQSAIERLNKLEPAEFALQMYQSDLGKGIAKNPVDTLKRYIEDDDGKDDPDGRIISDTLTATGRGFPPYHPNCRTRLRGLIPGVDDELIPGSKDDEDE